MHAVSNFIFFGVLFPSTHTHTKKKKGKIFLVFSNSSVFTIEISQTFEM